MKQLIIISFICLLILSCSGKDILDFVTDDELGDDTIGNDISYDQNDVDKAVQQSPKIAKKPAIDDANDPEDEAEIASVPQDSDEIVIAEKPNEIDEISVPEKPLSKSGKKYADVKIHEKPVWAGSKYVMSKIFSKPATYWYKGPRKNKVLAKARRADSAKKRNFITQIGVKIAEENEKIEQQKAILVNLAMRTRYGYGISKDEKNWLKKLAEEYRVSNFNPSDINDLVELKTRVDIIPESLAIAQAALESAWGNSRFARTGNNYFGHWCFSQGCGIVPKRRDPGKTHEVKVFKDPAEAVEAYIRNLNTHSAYKNFRVARKNMGSRISGVKLANYLDKYSTSGPKYERLLQDIIIRNNLE